MDEAEEATHRRYHIPGCERYQRRTKSTVVYAANNTTLHELSKALGGLMLHKWGDVKFTSEVKEKLKELSRAVDQAYAGSPKVRKAFITECVPNDERTPEGKERRVDLLRLEDDYRYEFEVSDHKQHKDVERGERTVTILIP